MGLDEVRRGEREPLVERHVLEFVCCDALSVNRYVGVSNVGRRTRLEDLKEAKRRIAGVLDVVAVGRRHVRNVPSLIVESASVALSPEKCHPGLALTIAALTNKILRSTV